MGFKRSTFEYHPAGVTIGTFVDHEYEPDGKYGPQTKLLFDTEEEKEDGTLFRLAYWVTDKVNPKSNANKFLVAMGFDPENMTDEQLEAIEYDDLLGKKCQLLVVHKKGDDGKPTHKVETLTPMPRRRERPAPKAEEPGRELVDAAAGGEKTGKWVDGDDD